MSTALYPPFPPAPAQDLSFLNTIMAIAKNPLKAWPEYYYHDMTLTRRMLGKTFVTFNDPEAIRQVLNVQAACYEKQVITRRILIPQAGDTAIFLAEGADWKRQRRILSPAFTPRNIEKLLPHFTKATAQWIASLDDTHPVNISNQIQRLTLKVAAQSMFSLAIATDTEEHIIDMFRAYAFSVGSPNFWDFIAQDEHSFAFATRKRHAFKKRWYAILETFFTQRAEHPPQGTDVLDLLYNAKDAETGEGLSHGEIRDEIATLISAGFETTARSLFWTFYLLARAPEWQDILLEEINAVTDLSETPTLEKIDQLKKTKAVWQEAMRLYPPGAIITRQAKTAHRIMDTDVAKGTMVTIAPWILHRHHAFWKDPALFDPTRFYDPHTIPKGIYIPFGSGPRVCIGNLFATAESILIIAAVVQRWKIELCHPDEPLMPVMLTATMPSHEPFFKFTPR